jgi:predicted secreted hydrolase
MRRRLFIVISVSLLTACLGTPQENSAPAANTGLRLLGAEGSDGFALATSPRDFVFPLDHGSHPEFRTEWWYFTGNLDTVERRHFGFELTFFRYALAAPRLSNPGESAWRSEAVWMAHLAVTDTAGRRFIARERLSRAALGLAGAETEPLRIWVKDWSAAGTASDDELVLQLDARDEGVALALGLRSTVPPIAQGDRGLDAKGSGLGNASYYYSMPRLAADGQITLGSETFTVSGLAWLDREWSTSSLEAGTVGWDWFALHLSEGSSLMFYRLRTASGEASPFSGGTLVSGDGRRTRLAREDVELTPLEFWDSAATGVRYPIAWRLLVPGMGLELEIRPYLEDQEIDLSVRYWEGAVHGQGTGPGGALSAQGYLELAGY